MPLFTVRFAHSLASGAGLPGSAGARYLTGSGKLLFRQVRRYRRSRGPDRLPPRRELEGSALVVPSDLILFSV